MIAQAAIKQNGVIYTLPRPARHVDVIKHMAQRGLTSVDGVQGFLDIKGNFLAREEAATRALSCGQVKELKFQPNKLFSEELW